MREFNDAALAALRGVWTSGQVYAVGAVPGTPGTPYAVVSASSGIGTGYRLSGARGGMSYRIVVQAVGENADEVGFAVEKADAAFLDQRLSVQGYTCTLALAEASSAMIRDPDGGVLLSCTLTYTFTAYPAA